MTRSVGTMNMARVKQLDLVRFIHDRYGVSFAKCGERYVCRSPLTNEKAPSFYVWRAPDGHWVFKCFSSGCSGSIVDFVMAREGCPTASAALSWINKEYGAMPLLTFEDVQPQQIATSKKEIDLEYLHKQFRDNDNEIVSIWLRKRGIADELASTLVCEKIAVHNRYKDKSYCCFAVRDHAGTLVCLDNHEIGGQEKFVLGRRTFFSLDHDKLDHAESVCVCEGIIDYLSVKTLMGIDTVGVALLGSDVGVLSPDQFPSARLVLSALDSDTAGARALLDLETLYPEKELSVFQMDDDCKDPNECLQKVTRGEKQVSLSASDKAQLYRDFCSSSNKTDVALRWGINRSYMYEIAAECEKMIVAGFENRRPGRKPSSAQSLSTLSEAHTRIKELENKIADEEKERQKWYARSKFLGVRLKYSEEEVAELRGQEMPRCVDMDTPARIPRHHVKKKKKLRR